MSNPFAQTDNAGDQTISRSSQSALAASIWDDMKGLFTGNSKDVSGTPGKTLDFGGDIYGFCPAGPEDQNTKRELSPDYGKVLNRSMDVKDFADKNFDLIDKDHDGSMSKDELAAAKKDMSLNAGETAALDILIKTQDDLAKLSNDEFGDEDNGVTGDDLNQFGNVIEQRAVGDKVGFLSLDFRFAKVDKDHDGYLSREEIDQREAELQAEPGHAYTGHMAEELKSLQEIRNRYDEIKDADHNRKDGDKGVSADDLGYYELQKKPVIMYHVEEGVEKHFKEYVQPREAAKARALGYIK